MGESILVGFVGTCDKSRCSLPISPLNGLPSPTSMLSTELNTQERKLKTKNIGV